MSGGAPVVSARGVSRELGGAVPATLVRSVDLEVRAGEFVAVTGPSGSGKSSLLYLLGPLDRPTSGLVRVDGVDTSRLDGDALAALRLARLGLAAHAHKSPDQLSGGQRQRVAIARALANDPALILADEPTGNLDTASARVVFDVFARLAAEEGRAVVVVTHDEELARRATRRLRMVDGAIAARDDGPDRTGAAGA
ncbi:MAG: ATP-binding cassette domain-containing protein [Alphaproteobacteria bacterium]|nr:ATP-binding cassette domain-containing protein [Alphaproteobacteria bacterium]